MAEQPVASIGPLGKRLATLTLLGLLALSMLLALPGMSSALRSIERVNPLWIAAAVPLELASDVGFVVVYRLFSTACRPATRTAVVVRDEKGG